MADDKIGSSSSATSSKSSAPATTPQNGGALMSSPGSSSPESGKPIEGPRRDPQGTRPPAPPEGAWAMRENERAPEMPRTGASERLYYGATTARDDGVGARAKDAAFESLRHAKNHAFDSISESVNDIGERTKRAGRGVSDFVGTHAIPLTLLGAGLGWLLVNMSNTRRAPQANGDLHAGSFDATRQRAGEFRDRASHALHEGRDRLVERAHDVQTQVTGRVKELSHQVAEGASHVGEQAAVYGRQAYGAVGRAGTRVIELGGDNPFVTGLVALVLGTAAGLLLPATRRENRLLGGTRDHLLHAAQRSATELKESAQHGAEELKSAITSSVQPSS